MTIKIPRFIYDRFDQLENIDYELEWIVGYMDKKIFREDFYRSISFHKDVIECNISEDVISFVKALIHSDDEKDLEQSINILYFALYVLGGTN